MIDYDALLAKYLRGLIKNKGTDRRYWLKSFMVERPFYRMILDELHLMWSNDSTMTIELVAERLVNAAKAKGLDSDEIYRFVADSYEDDISGGEVKELHDALAMRYTREEFRSTMKKLLMAYDSPDALDEALSRIRDLKALTPAPQVDLEKQLDKAIKDVENGPVNLIPFGIPSLDKHVGGVNKGEVEVIGGRPGNGKTSFVVQLAKNWLEMGYKVMIISKEMTTSRLLHKLFANFSEHLTSDDIKRGHLTPDQVAEMHKVAAHIKQYSENLIIYDDVRDSHTMETLAAKHRPDIIIDDYIQIGNSKDASNDMRYKIIRTMDHYKEIAKAYNCCVVTLSQLNREIEKREDPRPVKADLAESGAIEQYADLIIFLFYGYTHNPGEYPQDQVEIILGKNRFGPLCRVLMRFDGDHMRYSEMVRARQ